jgi:hypothetical protein
MAAVESSVNPPATAITLKNFFIGFPSFPLNLSDPFQAQASCQQQ